MKINFIKTACSRIVFHIRSGVAPTSENWCRWHILSYLSGAFVLRHARLDELFYKADGERLTDWKTNG